jgi:C1A family cysteine protease
MKAFLIAALVVVAVAVTDQEQWEEFKATYGKTYKAEEASRFSIFQSNLRRAEALQAGDKNAVYGVTKFSDLTPAEFTQFYANLNITQVAAWHRSLPVFPFSHHKARAMGIDWRDSRVTHVKDQGQCGSCWAFSAAAAAEGCAAEKFGKKIDLSAQQIVDCCSAGGSNGCNGGWPDQCLNWAMSEDIATWDSYTYIVRKEACKTSFTTGLPKDSCNYKGITGGESVTESALAHNPVSICLDATPLQSYRSGVISGSTCTHSQVDHAVLLVADNGDGNSYVVKNSWGTNWGESGFFRMAKGVNCLKFTSYNSQAVAK